ncbi:MAG: SAM-dependent methyltransferase [Planctomycetes bacterium]|nr:SAM-dependent methyltransferase [Planctomycetota bacterium]
MRRSLRIRAIADCVPSVAKVVVDVGTDHARLPLELLRRGFTGRIVATDLRSGPLEQARRTLRADPAGGRIELRRGRGLEPIESGEADVVCIAGLGGSNICEILAQGFGKLVRTRRLVLNPLRDERLVRSWLCGVGWRLVEERRTSERGYDYAILVAAPGDGEA